MSVIEFTHAGHEYRAWYANSESQTRRVLRLSTMGRPSRDEYAAARERAAELLEDYSIFTQRS